MLWTSCCGRYGDLLWSLPTLRALAAVHGRVGLILPGEYRAIAPLISAQPYIGAVLPLEEWRVEQTAPMTPWRAPESDKLRDQTILHLGHRGWPDAPLPQATEATLRREYPHVQAAEIDLETPWITIGDVEGPEEPLSIGFTDEWFELKYGLCALLTVAGWTGAWAMRSPRWDTEGGGAVIGQSAKSWEGAARVIRRSRVFLGCCSALHVLAVALGVPAVIMEPNPHRHHPIFWPLGTEGPRVTLVRGTDGQPTFDARHVREALESRLEAQETRS